MEIKNITVPKGATDTEAGKRRLTELIDSMSSPVKINVPSGTEDSQGRELRVGDVVDALCIRNEDGSLSAVEISTVRAASDHPFRKPYTI
jgi:hypothetical protein